MRIDLNQAASQIASESNPKPVDAENVAASDLANSGDRTTLTSTQQSLNALVSTAMSSPEVRQDRVDSLKQAISGGTYELDPEKIASSMIDEQA
ncbi:MAG: flagellar biosynthesis anti-sigma factor FlgM [Terracidiphilus sp.]|jgi:negative regulator of flagellin synthesis FlgM